MMRRHVPSLAQVWMPLGGGVAWFMMAVSTQTLAAVTAPASYSVGLYLPFIFGDLAALHHLTVHGGMSLSASCGTG